MAEHLRKVRSAELPPDAVFELNTSAFWKRKKPSSWGETPPVCACVRCTADKAGLLQWPHWCWPCMVQAQVAAHVVDVDDWDAEGADGKRPRMPDATGLARYRCVTSGPRSSFGPR